MASTLYRQYRPKTFQELVSQDHVTSTLLRAVESGRIAHAYLFYGPRGTGKTSAARILATRLNCTKATTGEPCGTCQLCRATQQGQNIDLIEIDAASNRGIDDIRALREGIGLTPGMGKYKVYIVDEVHMLTNEAFAALLKTLEEPVKHAVFILATTELHKVPETIISRCQVYRFRRATAAEMRQRLTYILKQEKRTVADDVLDFIIARSDGCFRDAESLLGQLLTLHNEEVVLNAVTEFLGIPPLALIDNFLQALLKRQSAPAITAIDEAFSGGYDPDQFVKECIIRARDRALQLVSGEAPSELPVSATQALQLLPMIIRALIQAQQDLTYVPQPTIALHLAVLTICTEKATPSTRFEPSSTQEQRTGERKPRTDGQTAPSSEAWPSGAGGEGAPTPTTPTQKPQPQVAQAAAAPQEAGTAQPIAESVIDLAYVKSRWPELIQLIKKSNPVASTFLRAMEPHAAEKSTLTLRAQYSLHHSFFGKPAHRALLETSLKELLELDIKVACILQEPVTTGVSATLHTTQQEEELLSAVQEVFGPQKE